MKNVEELKYIEQIKDVQNDIVYDYCDICCEQFNNNNDNNNIVYYKLNDSWKQYMFCTVCTKYILENKWYSHIDNIKNADCEKELKNLLNKPIINKLTIDSTINTEEVDLIYFDNLIHSSILKKPNGINLNEFNKKIKDVYTSMISNSDFNYLFEIKKILEYYNL
jgi:hypothetical protein